MLLCVPPAQYNILFHTHMARYSLYVLKVPLSTKQTNYMTDYYINTINLVTVKLPPNSVDACIVL